MKQNIREYSCLGEIWHNDFKSFDFVEFKCAILPKLEYSRMVCFIFK